MPSRKQSTFHLETIQRTHIRTFAAGISQSQACSQTNGSLNDQDESCRGTCFVLRGHCILACHASNQLGQHAN